MLILLCLVILSNGTYRPDILACISKALKIFSARFQKREIFNAIFGKIGRSASEEVLFELGLIKSKCLPILLYGTEDFSDDLS